MCANHPEFNWFWTVGHEKENLKLCDQVLNVVPLTVRRLINEINTQFCVAPIAAVVVVDVS